MFHGHVKERTTSHTQAPGAFAAFVLVSSVATPRNSQEKRGKRATSNNWGNSDFRATCFFALGPRSASFSKRFADPSRIHAEALHSSLVGSRVKTMPTIAKNNDEQTRR